MEEVKVRSVRWNVAALGSRNFKRGTDVRCMACSSVQVGHHAPLWAPDGIKHAQEGCRTGQVLPCGLHSSCFPCPFPLLPLLWATAACKPAVKLCYYWTHINLEASEKLVGKLKTFLEVKERVLWMTKKKIGVNETQWQRKNILFYKIWWLRKFPRGRRIRCFLCDSEWQLFRVLWLDSYVSPLRSKWERRD